MDAPPQCTHGTHPLPGLSSSALPSQWILGRPWTSVKQLTWCTFHGTPDLVHPRWYPWLGALLVEPLTWCTLGGTLTWCTLGGTPDLVHSWSNPWFGVLLVEPLTWCTLSRSPDLVHCKLKPWLGALSVEPLTWCTSVEPPIRCTLGGLPPRLPLCTYLCCIWARVWPVETRVRRGSAARGGRGCWRCAGARGYADTGSYPPSGWRSENEAHLGKTNT